MILEKDKYIAMQAISKHVFQVEFLTLYPAAMPQNLTSEGLFNLILQARTDSLLKEHNAYINFSSRYLKETW